MSVLNHFDCAISATFKQVRMYNNRMIEDIFVNSQHVSTAMLLPSSGLNKKTKKQNKKMPKIAYQQSVI